MRRRPVVRPHEELYRQCFLELDAARRVGFDGGEKIQPGDVVDWCRAWGITDRDCIADTWQVIRRLDLHRSQILRDREDEVEEVRGPDADA